MKAQKQQGSWWGEDGGGGQGGTGKLGRNSQGTRGRKEKKQQVYSKVEELKGEGGGVAGLQEQQGGVGGVPRKQGVTDSTQEVAGMAWMGAQRRLVSKTVKPQAEAWHLAVSNAGTVLHHHLHKQLFFGRTLQHPAYCKLIRQGLPRYHPIFVPLSIAPPPPPPQANGTFPTKYVVLEASPGIGSRLPNRTGCRLIV